MPKAAADNYVEALRSRHHIVAERRNSRRHFVFPERTDPEIARIEQAVQAALQDRENRTQ